MRVLAFHETISKKMTQGNTLAIMGKGLDWMAVLYLQICACMDTGMTFILNMPKGSEQVIIEYMRLCGHDKVPQVIIADSKKSQRIKVYEKKGVVFLSRRVAVMDLLTHSIDMDSLQGFILIDAHKSVDGTQEAFIIRLAKEAGWKGFVRAISDEAVGFTHQFAHLDKVTSSLSIEQVLLYPRFHKLVDKEVLDCPDFIEVLSPLTPTMAKIEEAIEALIRVILTELKAGHVDVSDLEGEGLFGRNIEVYLRRQYETTGRRIGGKVKSLLSDIGVFCKLLKNLVQVDCVSFYRLLKGLQGEEFGRNAAWIILPETNLWFRLARERVFMRKNEGIPGEYPDAYISILTRLFGEQIWEQRKSNYHYRLPLERNPRWEELLGVLKEIYRAIDLLSPVRKKQANVIVFAKSTGTLHTLNEVIRYGARSVLLKKFLRLFMHRVPERNKPGVGKGKGAMFGGKGNDLPEALDDFLLHLHPEDIDDDLIIALEGLIPIDVEKEEVVIGVEGFCGVVDTPRLALYTLDDMRVIDEVMPTFLVFYEGSPAGMRTLELFRTRYPLHSFRVYLLCYEGGIEYRTYMQTLRREESSFVDLQQAKKLISNVHNERVNLPEALEGRAMIQDSRLPSAPTVRSKGRVLVDDREFRSALPSMLHASGFEIIPSHLEVADYVLSPEVCVERKSLPDLFQSFQSGRLFKQMEVMVRTYEVCCLLIEFDADKPFTLSPGPVPKEISPNHATSKLVMLTVSFPSVRVLWSRSPQMTATLFAALKMGREEPREAVNAPRVEDADARAHGPLDFLKLLPGVTPQAVTAIASKVSNLLTLSRMSQDEIQAVTGTKGSAREIYKALHSKNDL